MRGIQPQSIEVKILEKTLSEFKKKKDKKKKRKREGKHRPGSSEQPLKNPYLDSKGFKLCKS